MILLYVPSTLLQCPKSAKAWSQHCSRACRVPWHRLTLIPAQITSERTVQGLTGNVPQCQGRLPTQPPKRALNLLRHTTPKQTPRDRASFSQKLQAPALHHGVQGISQHPSLLETEALDP